MQGEELIKIYAVEIFSSIIGKQLKQFKRYAYTGLRMQRVSNVINR
jgi:hypothetical protein